MAKLLIWGVLLVILIRALMRLARAFMRGSGYTRRGAGPPSVALVKDPVCGVFVAPSQALTSGTGAGARFFCSERCRSQWKQQ
jgi:YHS domain-containing protein